MNKIETINSAIKELFPNIAVNKNGTVYIDGIKATPTHYKKIQDRCKEIDKDYTYLLNDIKFQAICVANENNNKQNKDESNSSSSNLAEWFKHIDLNNDGKIIKNLENVVNLFRYHPDFGSNIKYNSFLSVQSYKGDQITDKDVDMFRLVCEKCLGYESRDKVETAISIISHEHEFNPITDALDNLPLWDGEERAESFFIDWLGVDDTKLNRTMTKKWLYAMIKRIYEPGCPFDNMLIVYDQTQGTGKSKLMQRLVECLGIEYGYTTTIDCDSSKDNISNLQQTWVACIDELNGFLKANPEQTKNFLAQTADVIRFPYERRSTIIQIHCVFYGTSNIELFLKDYTSDFERRYWIMEAEGQPRSSQWWNDNLKDDYLKMILAEMKYMYDNEPNFDYASLNVDEINELKAVQYRHKTLNNDDLLQDDIYKVLNLLIPENGFDTYDNFCAYVKNYSNPYSMGETNNFFGDETNKKDYVSLSRVPVKWLKQYVVKELRRDISTKYLSALIACDWEYKVMKYNGKPTNCYYKKDN